MVIYESDEGISHLASLLESKLRACDGVSSHAVQVYLQLLNSLAEEPVRALRLAEVIAEKAVADKREEMLREETAIVVDAESGDEDASVLTMEAAGQFLNEIAYGDPEGARETFSDLLGEDEPEIADFLHMIVKFLVDPT